MPSHALKPTRTHSACVHVIINACMSSVSSDILARGGQQPVCPREHSHLLLTIPIYDSNMVEVMDPRYLAIPVGQTAILVRAVGLSW